jgi:drug/metabolite transporter (DMT)-like permease
MAHSEGRHGNRGYALALSASVVLSTTGLFIRHLTEAYRMPALVLAFWRNALVVAALAPILLLVRSDRLRMRRSDRAFLVVFGLVLALFNGLWTVSVALTGAAIATVLVYSSAAFSATLGWSVLGEELDAAKVMAVLMATAGCVLISGVSLGEVGHAWGVGVGVGILSGFMYSVYGLMGRSASHRGLEPWPTLLYTFGFGTAFLLLPNVLPGGFVPGAASVPADLLWLGESWRGWGFLVALAGRSNAHGTRPPEREPDPPSVERRDADPHHRAGRHRPLGVPAARGAPERHRGLRQPADLGRRRADPLPSHLHALSPGEDRSSDERRAGGSRRMPGLRGDAPAETKRPLRPTESRGRHPRADSLTSGANPLAASRVY